MFFANRYFFAGKLISTGIVTPLSNSYWESFHHSCTICHIPIFSFVVYSFLYWFHLYEEKSKLSILGLRLFPEFKSNFQRFVLSSHLKLS